MQLGKGKPVFKLSETEARVAVAYLGETVTSDILASMLFDKKMGRRVLREGIGHYRPILSESTEDPDEELREHAPHLFEYDLSYDHRAPLLGAYVLCAAGEEPSRTDVLKELDLPAEHMEAIALSARDTLLHM